MSKSSYEPGLKALQDLLPPLEDCPNCGPAPQQVEKKSKSKSESSAK